MDLLSYLPLIAGLIGALGGSAGLVLFFTVRQQKKKMLAEAGKTHSEGEKTDAEAAEIVARTASGMLEPYVEIAATLRQELREARAEIRELRDELRAAHKRVNDLETALDRAGRRVEDATHRHGGATDGH